MSTGDGDDVPNGRAGTPNGFPDLPILDPRAGPDPLDLGERPTVLITGASGLIGRKLRRAWGGLYSLVLLDRSPGPGDPETLIADLAEPGDWMSRFAGADAVVHLAANPDPGSPWEAVVGPNLDATANVLQAAVLGAVERVVFASSNHVMGGYRGAGPGPITEDLPPRPDGPYGASKLFGERMGRSFALSFDLEFVALRIGMVKRGDNRRDGIADDWLRSMWLSDADLVQLFERALWSDLDDRGGFLVANATSANTGSRWSLDHAIASLGYRPQDDAEQG